MKRRYKVSKELKPYIRRILVRSFHEFKFMEDASKGLTCEIDMTSDMFHKVVQRAKCEKRSREDGTYYVTSREATNFLFLQALLEQGGRTSYCVIDDQDGSRRFI